MGRFEHIVFVCTNERDPSDARGSCQPRGGEAILDRLKALVGQHKLKGKVRVTRSGCLDYCAKGCAIAVFSRDQPARETWYTRATPADADALFESHIIHQRVLDRLAEHVSEDTHGELKK